MKLSLVQRIVQGWDAFGQAWGHGVQPGQLREELWIPFPPERCGSGQKLRTDHVLVHMLSQGNLFKLCEQKSQPAVDGEC